MLKLDTHVQGVLPDITKPTNEVDTDSNEDSKTEVIEIPANSSPLHLSSTMMGGTARGSATLKPTPDELYSHDSGSFNLVTGNGRCYTFNDGVVQKMDAQRIALLWEVGTAQYLNHVAYFARSGQGVL